MRHVIGIFLSITIGLLGLGWIALSYLACLMSDRPVHTNKDFWEPASFGIAAVLIAIMILFCGCTSTRVDYGTFHLSRVSFAQSVDVVVTKEGDNFKVQYGNDGGAAAGGKIAEGITTGVLIGK